MRQAHGLGLKSLIKGTLGILDKGRGRLGREFPNRAQIGQGFTGIFLVEFVDEFMEIILDGHDEWLRFKSSHHT